MASNDDLNQIAALIGDRASAPAVAVLTPDVRSGATFGYSPQGDVGDPMPPFLVVWFYTVEPAERTEFAGLVARFEGNPNNLPNPSTGVRYFGTFAVSVSSAAPDFEYRTVWGLNDLGKLKELNDLVSQPRPDLKSLMALIAPRPAMRTEIIGRARFAAPTVGK
ncbi:MAG: hypothetical protein KJZ80_13830 [Hyphomicrobiaceae bacterium]|nr:hypothetical protein [Hyphomicrobiaceae bacterium]